MQCDEERKHTCHLQQPVSQSALSMVNMSNDAKIPDSVHRELRQVNSILKGKRREGGQSFNNC